MVPSSMRRLFAADDLGGDGLCPVVTAQRVGSAVDNIAEQVILSVDQSVSHLKARLGDLFATSDVPVTS
jgi:hypothetical protein